MAPARILLSTLIASAGAFHGGPVVSRRQAAALSRRGFKVCVAAPRGERSAGDPFEVEIYPTGVDPRDRLGARCLDRTAVEALLQLIERFKPDVVYDVHGAPWAVDAASKAGVPAVSMMGDYNWFCSNSFLVNNRRKRCTGSNDRGKCFPCVNKWCRVETRAVQAVLRPAAEAGLIRMPLWDRLGDSMEYLARVRDTIGTFIVGDRKAHEFLIENRVQPSRIVRIIQGLPDAALRVRRQSHDAPDLALRKLRLAFVGRADPDKGLRVLAHAFDSLPRSLPVELWIVHADHARHEVVEGLFPSRTRFAVDLASGRVRLMRPRTQEEVFDIMAQADVGVVPSLAFESPCLAMLEFVAQRTPVVRSESAGMDHVIRDRVNGRTFPYGDSQALAQAILEIVADPSCLARWRVLLPRIGNDDEYAAQLASILESRGMVRRTTAPTAEEAHA